MLDLYKNIKKRRLELGMSQSELAKRAGYTDRSSIAKIESGKIDLTQTKIREIADALRIPPGDLMGWDGIDRGSDISKEDFELLELYHKLESHEQKLIVEMAKSLLKKG